MGPPTERIPDDRTLPEHVDVVIVGGGVIGISTARALAEKGLSVAVCEKGHVAGEQSSRNWGWCRATHRDLRELGLSLESLKLWRSIDAELGIDSGFRECGILYAADDAKALGDHEAWLDRAVALVGRDALDSRIVSPDETAALMPGSTRRFAGGIYTPSDGRAEPQRAVPAMAAALRERGVKVLTPCAVRGIETSGGAASGVVTEYGRIGCASVVVAGGAWTRYFAGNLGVDVPQLMVRSSVMRTSPVENGPDVSACNQEMGYRKQLDGGYTIANAFHSYHDLTPDSFRLFARFLPALKSQIGSIKLGLNARFFEELRRQRRWPLDQPTVFETVRTLDPAPNQAFNEAALAEFRSIFPALARLRVEQAWAGYIDVTPDAVPVISGVDRIPGLFIATGFSGHGFGIGPGAGRLMADLVAHDAPIVDPRAFRLSRFFDGSRIEIEGGF
ncbi:NAD(P)/FAD-dependent oxidoreductase [Caballeronia ptereochthonis]|uniref:FAD dependent oxidoreductase n=1 Tax=Caballeronia ptereochthonis TaxID=1777144 RepID=A0A157ZNK8_9BURK|nr:FAD-binding oxidoreductase [Caballeronia ptereochthonis]SAK47095.1 FAD dependent oxidoreductase [Caballeronia ptereochthonis]